jgi:hypothetical protein
MEYTICHLGLACFFEQYDPLCDPAQAGAIISIYGGGAIAQPQYFDEERGSDGFSPRSDFTLIT